MGNLSQNFSREEFACKCGCKFAVVDTVLLRVLEGIREEFDEPVHITSGCRCAVHNEAIGGSEKSWHMLGMASDFMVKDITPKQVYDFLKDWYSGGLGIYSSWIHIDIGNKRRWDKREA